MKKSIVIAAALVLLPASLSAQDESVVQKANSTILRSEATLFDSMTPRFSRDHTSEWLKTERGPLAATKSWSAPRSYPSQLKGQGAKKQRKWPYLMSGGIMMAFGVGLTAAYRGPCHLNCTWYCAVTCSEWSSGWVLGGGIGLMGSGGALMIYGGTRK